MTGPDENPERTGRPPDGPCHVPCETAGGPAETLPDAAWPALIVVAAAAVLLVSVCCLSLGIAIIFMHLYYIPILLVTYRYRYRGLAPAVLLSLAYVGLVYLFDTGQAGVIAGAWYRFLIFTGFAALVAFLSEQSVKSREVLYRSRETYRDLVENINDVIFSIDREGRFTYISPVIERLHGYRPDEVIGQHILHFLHPDDKARIMENFQRQLAGTYAADEFRIVAKDGTVRHVRVSPHRLGQEGSITGFNYVMTDITDRKNAEEEERLTRERFETLVTVAGMQDSGEQELSEYVMQAACRMTGSTLAFIGSMTADETIMDIVAWSRSAMQECSVTASPIHFPIEKAGIWADAVRERRPKIVNDYSAPQPGRKGVPAGHVQITRFLSLPVIENGKVVMVAAVANKPEEYDDADVTRLTLLMQGIWGNIRKRRADAALRESETLLTEMGEMAKVGGWEYDLRTNRVRMTRETYRIIGVPEGKTFDLPQAIAFFDLPGRTDVDAALQRCKESGEPFDLVLPYTTASGGHIWTRSIGRAIEDGGKIVKVAGTFQDVTELRKAQEALRESEEMFRGVAERSSDIIMLLNEHGTATYYSPSVTRILGCNPGEIEGKEPLRFIHPDDRERVREYFQKTLGGRAGTEGFEARVRRKNGGYAILEFSASPIVRNGTSTGLQVIGRDVTERKRAEERLLTSESRLNEAQRIAHIGSWELDPATNHLEWSDEIYRIFEIDPGRFNASYDAFLSFIHPDDRDRVHSVYTESIKNRTPYDIDHRLVLPDGRIKVVHEHGETFYDGLGRAVRSIGTVQDITERKRAEEALQESERKFREIFDNANDAIEIVEIQKDGNPGRFLDLNAVACRMLGYTKEELLQNGPLDIDSHNFSRPFEQILSELHESGHATFETEHRRKDGALIPVEINSHMIDLLGKTVLVSVVRDVTERKRAEEALQESERKFREIFDNANDAIEIVELRDDGVPGRFLDLNAVACRMHGYTKDELLRMGPLDISSTLYDRPHDRIIEELKSTGHATFGTEHIRKDGTTIPVEINALVITLLGKPVLLAVTRDITERKRAEEALRESETRFRELFNSMKSGVAVYRAVDDGADFTFIDFNHGAEIIEKIAKRDVIGRRVTEVFPGIGAFGLLDVFRRVWLTGNPGHHPVTLYRDDRIASWRDNYVYRLPSGEIVAIYDDVTARKKAEEALQESEGRLRTLIQTIPDLIWLKDPDGIYLACNPVFERFLGAKESGIVGKTDYEFFDRELAEFFRNHDRIAMEAGGPVTNEEWITFKDDGHRAFLETIKTPMSGKDGRILGVLGIGRDITERKRADDALRESEQKFRDIFNNTTDAIHIHEIGNDGTPGLFTDVNDIACRMLGYTREELLTKTPLDISTGYHNPPLETIFNDQRTKGVARFETEHRAKDGRIIPVEVNTHIVTIMGQKVMLGLVRDITERKKAEALLRDFNAELEQQVAAQTEEINASLNEKVLLLREIHHRVKNNLQIIISLTNLQLRQIDDERLRQVMKETQNRVRAMSLVHEKLYQSGDIARISLADYTRFLATQLFSFYGIDSRQVKLKTGIGRIMLDINTAIPVGLIVNELVSNALKHAFSDNRQGELSIAAREEGDLICLKIRDNGVGMPAGFSWDDSPTLGLRLVKILVEQLNGTIELQPVTEGTSFVIRIRKAAGAQDAAAV